MKISLTMIALNEEGNLERCLASVAPYVDEIVLCDTGSTDRTVEIAQGFGARIIRFTPETDPDGFYLDDGKDDPPGLEHTGKIQLASFAAARQRSLDACTGDFIFWVDADDIVEGAEHLRPVALTLEQRQLNSAHFVYNYSFDQHGNVTCRLWRERLVRRTCGARWVNPVHEVLWPSHPSANFHEVVIRHDRAKPRGMSNVLRNYKILLRQIEREKVALNPDPRTFFYFGNEARSFDRERAIWAYREYLERSGWDEERAVARHYLAKLHEEAYQHGEAFREFAASIAEMTTLPDGWFGLARNAFYRKSWQKVVEYTERGFALGDPESVLMVNPVDRIGRPHVCYSAALYYLGRYQDALASYKKGLTILPDNEYLIANREHFARLERGEYPTDGTFRLDVHEPLDRPPADIPAEALMAWMLQAWKRVSDPARKVALLEAMPDELKGTARWKEARAASEMIPALPPARVGLRIAIYTGPCFEPWNPTIAARQGIGGSETAAIEIALRLQARGHRVTVFGDCPGDLGGIFDGVRYEHHERYAEAMRDGWDIVVASRRPAALDHARHVRARLLWVHDIDCGSELTHERMLLADRVLALSQWHRGHLRGRYPRLRDAQVHVTGNGIDLARYLPPHPPRNPRRAVYCSSPDRGMEACVQAWTYVRREIPDAELHIYYGFQTWESCADDGQKILIAHLKRLITGREGEGIFYHGRVDQKTLAQEQLRSGVFAYLTWFSETSCLHPDTRIAIPGDHRGGPPTARIADLVGNRNFPVYAFDEQEHRFRIATAKRVWQTKIASEMLALDLDDGSVLRVTPDHLLLTYDGEWRRADQLTVGVSLRALHYRYNVAIRDVNGSWTSESRLVGEWLEGRRLNRNEHVDHLDLLRLDNRPESLRVMSSAEHARATHSGKYISPAHNRRRIEGYRRWARTEEGQRNISERASRNGRKLWDWVRSLSEEERRDWLRSRSKKKAATVKARMESDPDYAAEAIRRASANGKKGADKRRRKNHKIVGIRVIPGGPVFDMEVEDLHNFVAEGVVVHNCISAQEAHAAGLRMVSSPVAALSETIGDRGVLVPGYWMHSETQQAWAAAVVEAMRKPGDEDRRALQAYARERFDWSKRAIEWEALFEQVLAENAERLLHPFEEAA